MALCPALNSLGLGQEGGGGVAVPVACEVRTRRRSVHVALKITTYSRLVVTSRIPLFPRFPQYQTHFLFWNFYRLLFLKLVGDYCWPSFRNLQRRDRVVSECDPVFGFQTGRHPTKIRSLQNAGDHLNPQIYTKPINILIPKHH